MDKRLFFFTVIVPMMSLSMSELKKANSSPTTIAEYKKYKKISARKKLSKTLTPQPQQVAKRLLFYGKNYHRDGELTAMANELYEIAKRVNDKPDLLVPTNEFKLVERIAGKKECKRIEKSRLVERQKRVNLSVQ